jgi:phage repressor protein C with HTH and peptisase S24 domain
VRRLTVRASAGSGREAVVDYAGVLAFRKDWLYDEFRCNESKLLAVYVEGDSMEPKLSDGDVVIVRRDRTEVQSSGVFVFTVGNDVFVKRLHAKAGGSVIVLSDNDRYEPYALPEGARIEGRVAWRGGKV